MMTLQQQEELIKENAYLRLIHARQEQEIKLLRQKIDLLVRKIFGKSSENLNEQQLMLLLQGEDDGSKKADASDRCSADLEAEIEKGNQALQVKAKLQERKPRIPEHLPVDEELVIDPEEVLAEPENYRCIGQEVTEQLDYRPAKFSKRRIIRRKWVKRDEPYQAPVLAPLDTLAERSLAAPGLLAQIIVSKYCDHLPLYRQEQIYRLRFGIELPRQSMARWLALAAHWLKPVYQRIQQAVLAGAYVQCDETMIEYLEPGHGQTKQGYLWTLRRPGVDCVFQWHTSRGGGCLDKVLSANFRGVIGCDGYSAYQSYVSKSDGRLGLAACWAHVRRKFDEAKESYPKKASLILLLIQRLYQIEKELRAKRSIPKLREVKRASHSAMIVHRIGKLLRRWKETRAFLPQSLMGKAVQYTLNLWPHLQTFLQHGEVEMDNNLVENAIRPTALGKKNWLFIGEAQAGEMSAILYTIVEACRSRKLDPWEYLREVLTRLPSMKHHEVGEITPEAWQQNRSQNIPKVPEQTRQAAA